jgi:hypothetical protein
MIRGERVAVKPNDPAVETGLVIPSLDPPSGRRSRGQAAGLPGAGGAVPVGGWAVVERRDRERKDGVPSPEPGGCGCRLYDRRVWQATEILRGPCNQ